MGRPICIGLDCYLLLGRPICTERQIRSSAEVPEGYLLVYMLLNKSAQEYGYEQRGVLRIPCHVLIFERVLEALRLGDDLQDLFTFLSDDLL
ncbi:Auxin-responsive protein SAUR40 [Capsicum chinense]|nr:Auxin-responsive protein SAUR40 [Capsicum chinense]